MYGVSEGIDLSFLNGASLEQVRLGQHDIQFHFHPKGEIGVQGEIQFCSPSGEMLECGRPEELYGSTRLGSLLGATIVEALPSPPRTVVLRFDDGRQLRLIDSSDQYESFTIHPGDIVV